MLLPRFRGIVALAGLGAVLAAVGCDRTEAAASGAAPPPASVTVALPINREVMEWDEYTGRLQAVESVEVRARVGGFIDSVGFAEGGTVTKGQPLFVIDPRPYQAELDRARGEVARAKAQLALAETEYKRTAQLVPTRAASELELEEKRADRDAAKANVAIADAAVATAELNVSFTKVTAPISGRISRIFVTAGNLITGGAQGGEATLLTRITSLNPMYCYVDADERSVLRYQRLRRENKRVSARDAKIPARLALLNEPEFAHEGVIDFVDNQVDPTTGTLRARGVFPNPDGEMTPGMFGRLRIPGAAPYRALLVAQSAIQSDQSQKYVLTVGDGNVVKVTPVTVGSAFGTLRAIERGLTGDERVIVNGLLRARPGAPVNPTEGPMPGEQDLEWYTPDGRPPGSTTAPSAAPATRPTTEPVATGGPAGTVGVDAYLSSESDGAAGGGGALSGAGESLACGDPGAKAQGAVVAGGQVAGASGEMIPFGVPVALTATEGGNAR
jgi:multidrug efflux system membrane fusion protein